MAFRDYLKSRHYYTDITLKEKERHLRRWKSLCLEGQELAYLNTKELLKLLEVEKSHYTGQSLNSRIKTLEQYFYYLIEKGNIKMHPLKGFRIKTEKKGLLKGFLSSEELAFIYADYPIVGHYGGQFTIYRKRDKIVLGLMIYQGLNSGNIGQLKLIDLDLHSGKLNIPRSTNYRYNARVLVLEPFQILVFHDYLNHTRKELLKLIKTEKDTDYIFPSHNSKKYRTDRILKTINQYYPLESLYQLRISCIALWLKQYNLREVQHMAGYKSLLSLEKFNQAKLEKLKQSVEKYHPSNN